MTTTDINADYRARARDLQPIFEAEAAKSDQEGTATTTAVEAMRDAGMFGLMVPRELGGAELDLVTWTEVLADLSYASGSLGWTVLANSTLCALAAGWLEDDAVRTIFGPGPVAVAGQLTPRGTSTRVDGGFEVGGRYGFGSGSGHAGWIGGGARILRDGKPVIHENGLEAIQAYFVPRDKVEFTGGWDVMGLVGTGSYDYTIPSQVVPEAFTFDFYAPARRGEGAYRMGVPTLGVGGHAGWALGIARRAIDEALDAADRPQNRYSGPNAEREGFLHDIAVLGAKLDAARSLVLTTYADFENKIRAGNELTPADLARFGQVITHSTRVALECARDCFEWVGVSAIRSCPVQRCLLDVSVAAVHLTQTRQSFVAHGTEMLAGRGKA